MSSRTLRRWKAEDPDAPRARPGRPALPQDLHDEARELVRAELDRQGQGAGEKPIWRGLGKVIPLARVRRVLAELKAEHRARRAAHLAAARTTTRVLLRNAVWSMDATHLGRNEAGAAVLAEVVREVASTRTIGLSIGAAATGEDVVRLLDQTAAERGGAPLALVTDNGPAYVSRVVAAWCEMHRVLQLFSLPHTPQHNAASEHGMREIKEEAELDKVLPVTDPDTLRVQVQDAIDRIDHNRLRATRGWRTAVDDDEHRVHWRDVVDRDRLWNMATCAIANALLHSGDGRARRRAVREAILHALEHCSVIQRTRGGRSFRAQAADRVG